MLELNYTLITFTYTKFVTVGIKCGILIKSLDNIFQYSQPK